MLHHSFDLIYDISVATKQVYGSASFIAIETKQNKLYGRFPDN